ncbi:MAG: hypothetical protein ACP5XB_28330, partial [Isosphaeraceae bacterium]
SHSSRATITLLRPSIHGLILSTQQASHSSIPDKIFGSGNSCGIAEFSGFRFAEMTTSGNSFLAGCGTVPAQLDRKNYNFFSLAAFRPNGV